MNYTVLGIVAILVLLFAWLEYRKALNLKMDLRTLVKSLGRKGTLFLYASLIWTVAFGASLFVVSRVVPLSASDVKDLLVSFGEPLKWMLGIGITGNALEWGARAFGKNELPDPTKNN